MSGRSWTCAVCLRIRRTCSPTSWTAACASGSAWPEPWRVSPKFIVCDEPVSALDVSIQAQILNLLMDLQEQRELSYMFITHDLCVVKHISDEIMVMYMGQVVEHAKTAELFANPVHPYTKALLHAVPTIDLSKRNREGFMLRGEVTSPINPAPGCRFAPRCPYATDKCKENVCLKEVSPDHFVACSLCD